jgi:hypothetical protein
VATGIGSQQELAGNILSTANALSSGQVSIDQSGKALADYSHDHSYDLVLIESDEDLAGDGN